MRRSWPIHQKWLLPFTGPFRAAAGPELKGDRKTYQMNLLNGREAIRESRVHPFAGSANATFKAALAALTREVAADFGPHGVRVNAIAPREIDTSILSPGTAQIVESAIPMRRLGSPAASYINGAEIHINGGQHI
jgi:NAD(P)-dependent dehydrogenase (short-subunit alcohol dehydrogenase family)